jgi:hypothetical protein
MCNYDFIFSISRSNSSSPGVEDDDIFYICAADTDHITSWTKKGNTRILKHVPQPKHPYQLKGINK